MAGRVGGRGGERVERPAAGEREMRRQASAAEVCVGYPRCGGPAGRGLRGVGNGERSGDHVGDRTTSPAASPAVGCSGVSPHSPALGSARRLPSLGRGASRKASEETAASDRGKAIFRRAPPPPPPPSSLPPPLSKLAAARVCCLYEGGILPEAECGTGGGGGPRTGAVRKGKENKNSGAGDDVCVVVFVRNGRCRAPTVRQPLPHDI